MTILLSPSLTIWILCLSVYYYPWKSNILLQKILRDAAMYTMKTLSFWWLWWSSGFISMRPKSVNNPPVTTTLPAQSAQAGDSASQQKMIWADFNNLDLVLVLEKCQKNSYGPKTIWFWLGEDDLLIEKTGCCKAVHTVPKCHILSRNSIYESKLGWLTF